MYSLSWTGGDRNWGGDNTQVEKLMYRHRVQNQEQNMKYPFRRKNPN